jgi:hypothetical protein
VLIAISPGDSVEKIFKGGQNAFRFQPGDTVFGDDVDIPTALDSASVLSKVLSCKPFEPVTLHCLSNAFRNGNAKAVSLGASGLERRDKMSVLGFSTGSAQA